QDAWQYRWSSCRAHALGVNDSLLAPNPWYEQWSPEPTRRQVLWQEFVRGSDPQEEVIQADDWRLESRSFVAGCTDRSHELFRAVPAARAVRRGPFLKCSVQGGNTRVDSWPRLAVVACRAAGQLSAKTYGSAERSALGLK